MRERTELQNNVGLHLYAKGPAAVRLLVVPGQSEPSRKRPFVPITRLLPYGDRRVAPDKVASSRISPNLIRNGSVALVRR